LSEKSSALLLRATGSSETSVHFHKSTHNPITQHSNIRRELDLFAWKEFWLTVLCSGDAVFRSDVSSHMGQATEYPDVEC